jgi:putative CocE/NonD family hydrolase
MAMKSNRRGLGFFLRAALLFLLTPAGLVAAQIPAAGHHDEYGVAVVKNVMVPMRDGVKLATDIYLPARGLAPAPGKFPVLIERTPYGKDGQSDAETARFFARHGYVYLVQDVRGRFDSQGKFNFAVQEAPDGYDTVEWAARQPWSNGKVGTYGASYLGHVQNAMAVLRPPHLRAMFVMVGDGNYYQEGAWRGGAFMLLHNIAYALSALAMTSHTARSNPVALAALEHARQNLGDWILAYPFHDYASPFSSTPAYERWFRDYVDHYSYDAYWKHNGFDYTGLYQEFADIPIYYVTGWYDIFEYGNLHNFMALSKLHKSPTRLVVGPWTHNVGPRFSGDVDFGPSATVDLEALALRWFDQLLKGASTGVLDGPPVRAFVMGGGDGLRTADGRKEDGGEWLKTAAWPPPQETTRPFYFHGDGTLSEQKPADEPPSVYEYDPAHPVPTIGGQMNPGLEKLGFYTDGPRNQICDVKMFACRNNLPLAARHDVLVFETPPLTSDVVIAGPVTVDLWISSPAPDTDFTAKLVDVAPPNKDYPEGYAMNLEDCIIRVRWSEGYEAPHFLKAGEIRKVTIDLIGVANRFVRGHRIRVDISSSNFPYFDVNPNTGERPGYSTHAVIAINTVYHDGEHPSHINLPLLPASVTPAGRPPQTGR